MSDQPRSLLDVVSKDLFKDPNTGQWVPFEHGRFSEELSALLENSGYTVNPPKRARKRKQVAA